MPLLLRSCKKTTGHGGRNSTDLTLPGNRKRKHFAAQLESSIPSQETLTRALYPSYRLVSLRGSCESPQQNVSQIDSHVPDKYKKANMPD